MTNLELADKLQKEAGHFSGAQDLVGMLWDAGAALRNLHTENTALRATEQNLRGINAELVEVLKTAEALICAHRKPIDPAITKALAKAEGGGL